MLFSYLLELNLNSCSKIVTSKTNRKLKNNENGVKLLNFYVDNNSIVKCIKGMALHGLEKWNGIQRSHMVTNTKHLTTNALVLDKHTLSNNKYVIHQFYSRFPWGRVILAALTFKKNWHSITNWTLPLYTYVSLLSDSKLVNLRSSYPRSHCYRV